MAGNTAVTNLTFINDSTAPTAGTITYANGFAAGRSVSVTFTTGTDGGSGIATRQLQRAAGAPHRRQPAAPSAASPTSAPDSPDVAVHRQLARARACYKYRYVVTDRVGNQHIATSANVVKVDYAGAVERHRRAAQPLAARRGGASR